VLWRGGRSTRCTLKVPHSYSCGPEWSAKGIVEGAGTCAWAGALGAGYTPSVPVYMYTPRPAVHVYIGLGGRVVGARPIRAMGPSGVGMGLSM